MVFRAGDEDKVRKERRKLPGRSGVKGPGEKLCREAVLGERKLGERGSNTWVLLIDSPFSSLRNTDKQRNS